MVRIVRTVGRARFLEWNQIYRYAGCKGTRRLVSIGRAAFIDRHTTPKHALFLKVYRDTPAFHPQPEGTHNCLVRNFSYRNILAKLWILLRIEHIKMIVEQPERLNRKLNATQVRQRADGNWRRFR